MTRDKFSTFGIGQNVRLEWMEMALGLASSGLSVADCRAKALEHICGVGIKDGVARGKESAAKAMQMLRVWFAPKDDMKVFVRQLVTYAPSCPQDERVCLHWAILVGTFPFFLEVCSVVGRLLSLQATATKAQMLRRIEERYGVTPTTARNLEYALWILANFGLLRPVDGKGAYAAAEPIAVTDDRTALVLWKAVLHGTRGGRLALTKLRNCPAFYAFSLPLIYPSQFCEQFPDVDRVQYAGVDEQLFLKEEPK